MIPFILATFALFFCTGLDNQSLINKITGCCLFLVMIAPKYKNQLQLPQILLLVWLLWSGLGCFLSDDSIMAIQGQKWRVEGLVTWIVLFGFGYFYWTVFRTIYPLAAILFSFILIVLGLKAVGIRPEFFNWYVMPTMALASIMSMATTLFFACNPLLVIFPMSILCTLGNRSGFIAPFIGCLSLILLSPSLKTRFAMRFSIAGLSILILTAILSPTARSRFSSIQFDTLGTGSRSQWIMQADELAKSLPLTGFGLDTLSLHLKDSVGSTMEAYALADRVHNILLDILLQTGYIGLTIWLLCIGACVGVTLKEGGIQNRICLSLIITWIAFGFLNPQGIYYHAILCVAIFGIKQCKPLPNSSSLSAS